MSSNGAKSPVEAGERVICGSPGERGAVEVWVGRIEPLSNLGQTGEHGGTLIAHVSMRAEGDEDAPIVGHAPFSIEAVLSAVTARAGAGAGPFSAETLTDGYDHWCAAFTSGDAGWFTISPADAYWSMLEAAALKEDNP